VAKQALVLAVALSLRGNRGDSRRAGVQVQQVFRCNLLGLRWQPFALMDSVAILFLALVEGLLILKSLLRSQIVINIIHSGPSLQDQSQMVMFAAFWTPAAGEIKTRRSVGFRTSQTKSPFCILIRASSERSSAEGAAFAAPLARAAPRDWIATSPESGALAGPLVGSGAVGGRLSAPLTEASSRLRWRALRRPGSRGEGA